MQDIKVGAHKALLLPKWGPVQEKPWPESESAQCTLLLSTSSPSFQEVPGTGMQSYLHYNLRLMQSDKLKARSWSPSSPQCPLERQKVNVMLCNTDTGKGDLFPCHRQLWAQRTAFLDLWLETEFPTPNLEIILMPTRMYATRDSENSHSFVLLLRAGRKGCPQHCDHMENLSILLQLPRSRMRFLKHNCSF